MFIPNGNDIPCTGARLVAYLGAYDLLIRPQSVGLTCP
jgi:hypothetical protein